MTKHRAAIALSTAALLVAVLGQTAVGHAAASAVRVALFAQNSGQVNNIKASRTPKAGQLLPLNAKGKFPASVLPKAPSTSNKPAGGGAYTHTIVVHPDPDVTKAGTELAIALASINGNSATNPYLVKIEPGIYDVGTHSIEMKEWVDIEGSGETVTTILGANGLGPGTVVGADHSELRHVTVKNNGGGQQSVALVSPGGTPRFTHVTAAASGGSENYGIRAINGAPVFNDVTASATGGTTVIGLANFNAATSASNSSFTASDGTGLVVGALTTYGASLRLLSSSLTATGGSIAMGFRSYSGNNAFSNVTISASGSGLSYGIYNGQKSSGPTVAVNQSRISAQTNSIFAVGGAIRVGASQLAGPAGVDEIGTVVCVVSYNGSFAPLGSSCS